jgi:hypothetical protein
MMDYYYFEEKENPISPRNIIDDMDSDVAGLMFLLMISALNLYCKS